MNLHIFSDFFHVKHTKKKIITNTASGDVTKLFFNIHTHTRTVINI